MEYVYYGYAAILWCVALAILGGVLLMAAKSCVWGTPFFPRITINRKGPKWCPHCGRGIATGRTKVEDGAEPKKGGKS